MLVTFVNLSCNILNKIRNNIRDMSEVLSNGSGNTSEKTFGYSYEYPKVDVTATVVLYRFDDNHELEILLGIRHDKSSAFPGFHSLIGGFINPKTYDYSGERIEETAIREAFEEVNITILETDLELFYVSSNPETDPRGHVVNVCYSVNCTNMNLKNMKPGDDIQDCIWMKYKNISEDFPLAFNHRTIIHKFINSLNF